MTPTRAPMLLIPMLALACGARSELRVPDAPPSDVAADLPLDAPPPECRTDRDCDDGLRCTENRRPAGPWAHTWSFKPF